MSGTIRRTAALALAAFAALSAARAGDDPGLPPERALGSPDAPLTVVAFYSMSCPHCAWFHKNTFPQLKEKYIDTGKVRMVFRDFPLNKPAVLGAMVAHCSGEKYFDVIDDLLRNQDKWVKANPVTEALKPFALAGGMTEEEFAACRDNQLLVDQIINSRMVATEVEKIEIPQTPTFLIGDEVVSGAKSFEEFETLILAHLPE